MRINSSVSKLNDKQRVEIIEFAYDYCLDILGYNHRKKNVLNVIITKNDDVIQFGDYSPVNNIIRIYHNKTKNICKLIETFVHEYVHSLQPCRTKYFSLLNEYGYNNHPFEVEAREVASKHKKIIWKKFLEYKKIK
jgi:hypothetical protein